MGNNKIKLRGLTVGLFMFSTAALAQDPYSSIIEHQENGRFEQALSQVNQLLVSNQNDFRALLLKGNVNKLMGNSEQAIEIFKRLIKQFPHMPEPYNNLAVLYADSGQTSLAVETLQQVFSTSHSYSAAFNNLRNLYNEMASSAYREALDLNHKKPSSNSKYTLLNEAALMPQMTSEETQEPEKAVSSNKDNNQVSDIIAQSITDWSQAWANRKPKIYFAFYHAQFVPPNAVNRKEWERVRAIRLSKPKYIEIDIVGLSVQNMPDKTVTAMFEQHYRSDTYKDTVVKVLTFKKQKGQWLIVKEDVL